MLLRRIERNAKRTVRAALSLVLQISSFLGSAYKHDVPDPDTVKSRSNALCAPKENIVSAQQSLIGEQCCIPRINNGAGFP